MLVVVDERVGGIDDGLRGAVVALEFEQPRIRVRLLESKDVANIRSAEGIDGLGVIADDTDVVSRLRQHFDEQELRIVGVLVLVHKDVLEHRAIERQRLGVGFEQAAHVH